MRAPYSAHGIKNDMKQIGKMNKVPPQINVWLNNQVEKTGLQAMQINRIVI